MHSADWPYPPPQEKPRPGRCFDCRMPESACICAQIPVIRSKTKVLIIRHCKEISLTSNTGRVVARAMPEARMVDFGLPGPRLDLTPVIGPDTWVLSPGAPVVEAPKVDTIIVLDATWSQVQSMRRRIAPLPGLPVLSLPAPVVAPLRMRRGLGEEQMATIEAVAAALAFVGEPEPAEALRAVFATMALRMQELRGFVMPPKVR